MSLFAKVNKGTKAKAEKDSLGGSRLFDSGLVDFDIEVAFISIAKSGAMALNVHCKETDGARTFRVQEWIYSGDAKGNRNTHEKDGEEFFLPGWNVGNAISQLAADRTLDSLTDDDVEDRVIKLYDFTAKAETNQTVKSIGYLKGTKITFGVLKELVDKNVKNDAGEYVASGETREQNVVGKVFHTDTGCTLSELVDLEEGVAPEAKFRDDWAEKFNGTVRDKSSKNTSGAKSGAPQGKLAGAGAGAAKPTGSLFGNKDKG